MKGSKTATSTKEISQRAKHMEREYLPGPMEKFMTENGTTESRRAMAYGRAQRETRTSVSG
jgi:hypothetical protein